MALRRTPLLLTTIAMAVLLVFVYGCQSDRQGGQGGQGGSRSSKTTAQSQTTEKSQQTQGGDLGEARSELGPKVEKIMGSSFYRYGQ
jgi:hypothetical protein